MSLEILLLPIALAVVAQAATFYASLGRRLYGSAAALLRRMADARRRKAAASPRPVCWPDGGLEFDQAVEAVAIYIVKLLGPAPGQGQSASVGTIKAILVGFLQTCDDMQADAAAGGLPPDGCKDIVWLEG